jgi:2-polyprenyl-3-methyl-5-hydroxy-6-metoxy-1,4-benzoquinol methylase/uncharacterized protein YbaR (Trm112 family)
MNANLVQLLRCPLCRGTLTLSVFEIGETSDDISSGLLQCECKMIFPVWKGVPRMIPREDASLPPEFLARFENLLHRDASEPEQAIQIKKAPRNYSFDVEWSMYRYGELTWELDLPTRVGYVYQYLEMLPGSLDRSVVLDAGCGNGTLSAGIAASGPRVVALDYSDSIERAEAQKKRFAGAGASRLDYVQGDLRRPPFAPKSFDVVYCDGVLHHTSDTHAAFQAVAALVKVDGRMFTWLYRSDLKPAYKIKSMGIKTIRSAMRPLPGKMVIGLCYVGAVILQTRLRLVRLIGIRKRRIVPLWLKTVNLYDTFTPLYNHQHVPSEVISWFREEDFSQASESTIPSLGHMGFGILGIKNTHALRVESKLSARATSPSQEQFSSVGS